MKDKKIKSEKKHLKNSKTKNFLERIRSDNSMVEYFTQLRIMNPAAQLTSNLNEPRREGGFVRLAHAREEFTAPVITKGKSVALRTKRISKAGKRKRVTRKP
jgi:hypothetical protein